VIPGTNPLGAKLYNWLSRNRTSVDFQVSQTVVPVASMMDLWPKSPEIRVKSQVLTGGIDTLVIFGVADAAAAGGPLHAMLHRAHCNISVNLAGMTAAIGVQDTNSGQSCFVQLLSFGAGQLGNFTLTPRDVYIPPTWNLQVVLSGSLLDTFNIFSELSIDRSVEPLPRGI
jgi:hypothetical protein